MGGNNLLGGLNFGAPQSSINNQLNTGGLNFGANLGFGT